MGDLRRLARAVAGGVLAGTVVLAAVACGSASAPASGGSAGQTAAQPAAQPQAKKPVGTVTLYTADGLEDFYKAVLPGFEKQYGAKVNIVTDGSGAVVNRVTLEKDAPKADVLVTLPPFVQQAAGAGLLAPFKSSADSHIPSARKDPNGMWTVFVDNYASFIYNPQLSKTPPSTFADLLNADYNGAVAYSNPLTAGDGMGVIILLNQLWGPQKAFSYLSQLEQNVKFHTKGTGYLDVLVSRGEVHVANGDLQMDMDDKTNGGMSIQPIFLRPAADQQPVTFEDPYDIAVVKGGPNTAGGQQLIDYLLSQDVQAKTYDVFGLPARDDVPATSPRAQVIQQALQGVKVVDVDWNQVLSQQQSWQKQWQTEVLGAYGKQADVVAPKQ